jgi:phosphotransferase system  glucose/maltose/N-acetylglucosamine-specific IIC component
MDSGVGFLFVLWILLIAHVVIALVAAPVANQKGHDMGSWFAITFLTGIIGLIAIAGLPDLKQRKYLRLLAEKAGLEPGD